MICNNLRYLKGIVFDLDDTLYPQDTFKRSGFKAVANWMSQDHGYDAEQVIEELEDIMQKKGASYPSMFNDLAERLNINKISIQQMVQIFIEHEPIISCFPGVHAMLVRLRKRFKLGLLTDGRLAVQRGKIRALRLETEFNEILCSDLLGLEKPANELYEWFEWRLKLTGRQLIYVGDNPRKDFYGANMRRWTTVCVLTGENKNTNRESNFKPCFDIPSVIDLEKLIKSDVLF